MAFFASLVGPMFKIVVPEMPGSELRNAYSSIVIANASRLLANLTYLGTLQTSERIVVYTLIMGAINGYFASNQYRGILQGGVGQVSIQLISSSFFDYLTTFVYYTNPDLDKDLKRVLADFVSQISKGATANNAPAFG